MMEKLALRRFFLTSLLILVLFNFLVTSSANAAIVSDVTVKVSPGEILPDKHNDYLGNLTQASPGCNNDTIVKCEYPKGMILQQTVGDLLFNITVKSPKRIISVYIPPEFGVQGSSYVWSSITNDYRFISRSTLSSRDPIAPSWFRVQIRNATSSINPGSHFIRLFNVTAPSIVGLYFFKVFVDGNSIGAKNFPILVVSADPNPAYISGRVVDCSYSFLRHYPYNYSPPYGYGGPIQLGCYDGGKVVAEGVTPDGRKVVGQAFFNSSALGKYTVYGLAAGTYNLTAYASGYWPTTMNRLVTLRPGQSSNGIDLCIYSCPRLEGIVRSKCENMNVSWGFIATRSGPGFGAALAYVGTFTLVGQCAAGDLIYALRGNGTSDFLRYDAISNKWTFVSPTPGPVGPGGSLAFNRGNSTIYALEGGGSSALWAYDVANDQWQTVAPIPNNLPVADGGSLTFNSNDGYLYALRGGNTTDFWQYRPTEDRWQSSTSTPTPVLGGGSLVFNQNDGYLYALRGGGHTDFWRINPVSNAAWQFPQNSTVVINSGASLTFNTQDGFIYTLAGGSTNNFLKYDPTANTWTTLANVPSSVEPGGSLTFDTLDGLIYTLVGGGFSSFFTYNYGSDAWNTLTDFLLLYPRPVTIEILDSIDNSWRIIQNFTDPNSDSFNFTYDGSTELNGHIPQDPSGYVAGIPPGPYKVRVWINQYTQPQDTIVDFSSFYNPAAVRVEFDVYRTGTADIRIHFKGFPQGQVIPVNRSQTVTVALYDRDAILRGQNYTRVPAGMNSTDVIVTGFLGTLHDYGLPDGTYKVIVTVGDFFQYYDFYIAVSGCDLSEASLDVIQTGSLILSIRSVNSQSPPQPQNWISPGANIRVDIVDQYNGIVYGRFQTRQNPSSSPAQVFIPGLRGSTYLIHVYTFGYYQKNISSVNIVDGITSDITVNIVVGSTIDLSVILQKEGLPAPIDTYPFSTRVPFRAEVYDALDNFVAANLTYVPSSLNTYTLRLAGFRNYAGDPAIRWTNYYDATDGHIQTDYGLPPGSYRVVAYLPGYSQGRIIDSVTVPVSGRASVVMYLNRLTHLTGYVSSLNMFGELVPINWATIDAIGSEFNDFTSTLDGSYSMWLPEGQYLLICSLPGYDTISTAVNLVNGSDTQINFRLNSIYIAVPEFNSNLGYLSTLVIGICVASLLLRRSGSKYERS
jgi:hypothetical protein